MLTTTKYFSILGRVLREKAQLSACKDIVKILSKSLNSNVKEEGLPENSNIQHLQVREAIRSEIK